jgi:hypothetical protein
LALNGILEVNQLLFDFVLKRTIHAPGTLDRFPPSVFMENAALLPARR